MIPASRAAVRADRIPRRLGTVGGRQLPQLGGLMIVGRILGWILLFCALVLLGWDAVSSLTTGTWGFAVLGQRWYEIDQAFGGASLNRSEEHTSELQSLMRISYAVFCLKQKKKDNNNNKPTH